MFQEVDDALSQKLSKLMWEGPEDDLLLTENAQPAIMAASIAVVRILEKEMGLDVAKHAYLVAGHSLGEYSALCAAGAFPWPIPRGCSRLAARRCSRRCRWARAA